MLERAKEATRNGKWLFRRICGLLQSDAELNALILSGFRDE